MRESNDDDEYIDYNHKVFLYVPQLFSTLYFYELKLLFHLSVYLYFECVLLSCNPSVNENERCVHDFYIQKKSFQQHDDLLNTVEHEVYAGK